VIPPAAAFCTTCSALVAPAITLPTIGFPASQAIASCASLIPRPSAIACRRSIASRFFGKKSLMKREAPSLSRLTHLSLQAHD
jgi:hypothetical protein